MFVFLEFLLEKVLVKHKQFFDFNKCLQSYFTAF